MLFEREFVICTIGYERYGSEYKPKFHWTEHSDFPERPGQFNSCLRAKTRGFSKLDVA